MPIGVQGYTTRYRVYTAEHVEETYKKLAAMGYDGSESGLGGRVMSPEEDIALLKKYGLKVADTYGDLSKPDEVMKRAEMYGVKIVGAPSVPNEMLHSVEGFKTYAKRLNELAKPFKGTGIRLQYHNHSQEFRNFPQLGGKAGMAILIEETDPDMVVFELDTFWMSAAGCDPVQWIEKVSGRIPIVHFKDLAIDWKAEDGGMGQVYKRFAEIGQGNINWPPIVAACVKAGVEWYCVEQDRTVLDEFECLKISIDYMRSIGVK
ncbi:MAG: sugar phosphate isomerase/epimerase [Oscillospiraceae bacterium]|nr:sugar phosphate isomerase/epimerase [Oscillospiraceae bacterium]